ncbi:MAG TPA: serine hydrolase domain-containing protein [Gaiellaceae bacterium]|nr:serine hydrolase domain-containing protein [Gaiellaceae bacterium]
MAEARVEGRVEPGFEPVRDAFADGFASAGELGASAAAVVDGTLVVDLWGGSVDETGRPWQRDTLVNVFSVTKPLAAACLLVLVERGRLALDDAVARWWPEFEAAGKEEVTVRQVLAHQAGLDYFREQLAPDDLLDWDRATALLAGSPPRWPPGSTHGEHAAYYGHLVGELVRRVDGRSLGRFLRDELAGPWQLDFHVGLGPGELTRAADVVDPDGGFRREALAGPEPYRLAVDNPPAMLDPAVVNSARWREAEIPAVNGHGTARAVAQFYAGLAAGGVLDGVRLLSDDLVAQMLAAQHEGEDEVVGRHVAWGLGVQVDAEGYGLGGIGGSAGWWDTRGYAFGYATRRLGTHDCAEAVEAALARCLER